MKQPVTGTRTVSLLLALLVATILVAYWLSPVEPSAGNSSRAEVVVGPGEALRVTYIGDSLDAGLYATDRLRGFHSLMVNA